MTTVTLAELSVGPLLLVARTDQERAARQAHLQQAETDFDPIPFDALQPGHSDKSPPRCGVVVARSSLAHMTP